MKKKLLALLLATSMTFSVVACGTAKEEPKAPEKETKTEAPAISDASDDSEEETEPDNEEDSGSLSAEKNLLSVEVILPASLVGEDSADLTEAAKSKGVKEVTKNDDGSITFKMTKAAHKDLLDALKTSIDETIAETLADKENCPSFDSITYNDDVTVFDIKVDAATYGGFESLYALTYYMVGNMYQALNAVPEDQLKTVVNFIDKDTGDIIESGDSTALEESVTE